MRVIRKKSQYLQQCRHNLLVEDAIDSRQVNEQGATGVKRTVQNVEDGTACLRGWLSEVPHVLVVNVTHDPANYALTG